MLKQTVLVSFLHLGILLTAATNSYSDMMPCPSFKSQTSYDINKLMGEWNLAMLLIDEYPEQHEDDSTCIQGNFKKINDTAFKQMWYMSSSQYDNGVIIDLPTTVTHSGDWTVIDPFGGHLQVKIGHASPKSQLSMTFCRTEHGKSVHLWTAVATRKTPITQIDFLALTAELVAQGFNISNSQMIMWNRC